MDVQKIDGSSLETYKMIIALFFVDDKDIKIRFFEKIFLLADITINDVFVMLFFTLNNIEVKFNKRELI